MELYERLGKAIQSKHLGQPLAYMTTETGNPNQYVHIWVYENAGDREAKRAAMWADPDWIAYPGKRETGGPRSLENKLMTPDFFDPPLRPSIGVAIDPKSLLETEKTARARATTSLVESYPCAGSNLRTVFENPNQKVGSGCPSENF